MTNEPTTWAECAREDLRLIPYLKSLGWTAEFNHLDRQYNRIDPGHVPNHGVSFTKGAGRLWWSGYWIWAEYIDDRAQNHIWFTGHQRYPFVNDPPIVPKGEDWDLKQVADWLQINRPANG